MYDTDSRPGLDGTAVMRKPPSIRTLSWTILLLLLFGLGMCVAEHHAPPVPPSSTVTITTGNPAGPTGAPKVRVFYESPTSYGAPDLVYNCAVMPNICANINILYPLNANMGIDTSKSPTGEWWIPLHWDADTTAKHKRRKARCGKFDAKQCPNANTLPVTGRGIVDADGSTAYVDKKGKGQDGAVKGGLIDLGKAPKGVPDLAYITNEKKELLGMIWSCEEWPPAS